MEDISMSDTLISFDTARLSKEKGFNIPTSSFYIDEDKKVHNKSPYEDDYNWNRGNGYSAPTQSLLQKWLREIHSLHIISVTTTKNKFHCWAVELNNVGHCGGYLDKDDEVFETYEEALEIGLQEALNICINK